MDKNELLAAMSDSYAKLNEQIGKMTDDTTDMAAYFSSVTTSPYGQATKLLKTHQKSLNKK
ncbi:MAG: hypothetical protein IJK22_12065 [Bacteroidales bacterium]|nr:hypothetical protein [Bacteroidales bacterium]MBQ6157320.1 hypothetical protein [Bacteroidales bacterium]